jgi:hypothetical protein
LIAECFFLWDNEIINDMFFGPETLGSVTIEPAAGIAPETAIGLYSQSTQYKSQLRADSRLLSDALDYQHTRVRVARGDDGAPIGFSMVVPICKQSIALLERHPMHAGLINAYFSPARRALLPGNSHDATAHYLLPIVAAGEQEGAVRCALFRELAAIFGSSGTYLCMNRESAIDRLLEECHFEVVVESRHAGVVSKGWALDLTRVGFEGWIQAVVDGREVQAPPSSGDLETEILAALAHWDDTHWLTDNCRHTAGGVAASERAEQVRHTITDAFSRARTDDMGSNDKALRALELAYFKKSGTRKQAMRSLSVSRATLYRLCRRGVGVLAERVVTTLPANGAKH